MYVSVMSVIPQTRVANGNGRSSDFILTRCSVFPEISKFHPSDSTLTPVTLLATPLKKDSQHRVMSGIFTPFPS